MDEISEWEKVELSPFWKPEKAGEAIEGFVSAIRTIEGEYGENTICTLGDYTVGISAGLTPLLSLEGEYVKLIFEGRFPIEGTKKEFKKFTILHRKKVRKI